MSFLRDPVILNRPTYVVLVAQTILLGFGLYSVALWAFGVIAKRRAGADARDNGARNEDWFPLGVGLIMGSSLLATRFWIPTHYVLVCWPLPLVWFAEVALTVFPRGGMGPSHVSCVSSWSSQRVYSATFTGMEASWVTVFMEYPIPAHWMHLAASQGHELVVLPTER